MQQLRCTRQVLGNTWRMDALFLEVGALPRWFQRERLHKDELRNKVERIKQTLEFRNFAQTTMNKQILMSTMPESWTQKVGAGQILMSYPLMYLFPSISKITKRKNFARKCAPKLHKFLFRILPLIGRVQAVYDWFIYIYIYIYIYMCVCVWLV